MVSACVVFVVVDCGLLPTLFSDGCWMWLVCLFSEGFDGGSRHGRSEGWSLDRCSSETVWQVSRVLAIAMRSVLPECYPSDFVAI